MLADGAADESLDLGRWHTAHRSGTLRLSVQEGRRQVIAILDPFLADMARAHSVAPVVVDATDQERARFRPRGRVIVALLIELSLHRVKEITIENGGLLAGEDLALEDDLAEVKPIAQKMGGRAGRG